jgi:hypothetical protein
LRLVGLITGRLDPAIVDELNPVRGNFPSFAAMMFKTLHPHAAGRPPAIPMAYELAGTALGLLLLGLTLLLLFAWQPKRPHGAKSGAAAAEGLDAVEALLAIGCLTAIILPLLPTLKPHYYALLLPLATGLAAAWLERPNAAGRARRALVAAFAYACAPGFLYHALRRLGLDELALGLGLDTYAGLALWAAGLMVVGARRRAREIERRLRTAAASRCNRLEATATDSAAQKIAGAGF